MNTDDNSMVPVYHGGPMQEFIDLESASRLSGMHPVMILEFVRAELVEAARVDREGNPCFDEEAIFRLRQIEHMRTRQGAHLSTIRLVIRLIDRAESAERELRRLRNRMR